MLPSCGTHADTLGQSLLCVPERWVASKCLGAALERLKPSTSTLSCLHKILLQMSSRANGVGGLQLFSKTMAADPMEGHSGHRH